MKTKLLHESNGLKTFAIVFEKDEMPVHLRRTQDEESGLALINLAA